MSYKTHSAQTKLLIFLGALVLGSANSFALTFSEIQEKAENLHLRGERKQAAGFLLQNISKRTDMEEIATLTHSLNVVVRHYYKTKTLQEFELARGKFVTDTVGAIGNIEKAHALEPDHFEVNHLRAWLNLRQNRCKTAEDSIQKMQLLSPFDKAIGPIEILLFACKKDQTYSVTKDVVSTPGEILSLVHYYWQIGDKAKVQKYTDLLQNQVGDHPEVHFYRGQLSEKGSEQWKYYMQNYVKECRKALKADWRQIDPWTCRSLANIVVGDES